MYFVIFVFLGKIFLLGQGQGWADDEILRSVLTSRNWFPPHGLAIKVAFPQGSSCSKLEFYEQG